MIKFGSYPVTLPVPFEQFSESFNAELHFELQGFKKRFFHRFKIKEQRKNYIRIWERKALHCNYYPDDKGNTVVEYTAEISIFVLIILISSLFLIIGFLTVPVYIFGNRLGASQARKRVIKHQAQCIQNWFPNASLISSSTFKKSTDAEMNVQEKQISLNTPPPIKKHSPPPIPSKNNLVPPPIPVRNKIDKYYVLMNDQQKGPYTIDKIALLVDIEQIDTSTLIWKEGTKNWVEASEITEINTLFKNLGSL
jgi:hypothetical protein